MLKARFICYFFILFHLNTTALANTIGGNYFSEETILLGDTITMSNGQDTLVASCEGVLVDDGGISNSYENNTFSSLTIEGTTIELYEFSFDFFETEQGFDFLSLYADTGNGLELIDNYSGNLSSTVILVEALSLQLLWGTDGSVTSQGFIVSWECIPPIVPSANFQLTTESICFEDFNFEDLSTGIPDTWTWYLDDVMISVEQNPTITVSDSGTYDVSLIVCNEVGCDTLIQPDLITYDENDPSCSFIEMIDGLNYSTDLCQGTLIDDGGLNNTYENNVESTVVIGGNGTQLYEINIEFFNVEFNFDVLTLNIDNGNGFEFYTQFTGDLDPMIFEVQAQFLQFIWDTDGSVVDAGFEISWQCDMPLPPIADFSTEVAVNCSNIFSFQDDSQGFPSSWIWFLNDEIVSTEENPIITVPSLGTYDIGLIVCNEVDCDTLIQTDFITFDNEAPSCSIISMEDELDFITSVCEGTLTDDGGVNNNYSNNVNAILRVEVPDAVAYRITIDEFSLETGFDDLVIYHDLGNGYEEYATYTGIVDSTTFLLKTPRIQFVFDTDGSVDDQGFIIYWECIGNQLPPQASVSLLQEECTNTVSFNIDSNNTDSVSWDFGDGNTGEGIDVEHTYNTAGTYTVESVSTNQYGSTTNTTTVEVSYVSAFFDAPNEMLINTPETITLDSHTEMETESIAWYLDGELLSNDYALDLELSTLGTYSLECVLTDTSGCVSAHVVTIEGVDVLATNEEAFSNLLIFPNPFQDQFTIQGLNGLDSSSTITLFNTVGKIIFTQELNKNLNQFLINTNDLTEGIYFLQIQTNKIEQFYKVLKVD